MRFRIRGVDQKTGEQVSWELESPDIWDARLKAEAKGVVISSIERRDCGHNDSTATKDLQAESISFFCQRCGRRLKVSSRLTKIDANCPNCHAPIVLSTAQLAPPNSSEEKRTPTKSPDFSRDFSCPVCGSGETRKLSALHAQGTVTVQEAGTTTARIGDAIFGTAVRGTTITTGVHQSALAKLAAPPAEPFKSTPVEVRAIIGVGVLLVVVVFAWKVSTVGACSGFIEGAMWAAGVVIGAGVLAGVAWSNHKPTSQEIENEQAYQDRKRAWERKFICLRCGKIFINDAGGGKH